jgi:hypothetical protein
LSDTSGVTGSPTGLNENEAEGEDGFAGLN